MLPHHYLRSCILLVLADRPAYGYDLRPTLMELGCGMASSSQVYRALRGMEADGLVVSCWESSDAGPPRRTYHLTESGQRQLASYTEAIAEGARHVEAFLSRRRRPMVATA